MLLDDGFSTRVVFATSTFTLYEETEVTPPSLVGGGSKNTTTMANTRLRTKSAKRLYEVGDIEMTVRYDPAILDQVKASIQVNQLITLEMPDGDEIDVWGWLEEFVPGANAEGDVPTADIVIVVSNRNATNVETAPVYRAAV